MEEKRRLVLQRHAEVYFTGEEGTWKSRSSREQKDFYIATLNSIMFKTIYPKAPENFDFNYFSTFALIESSY